MPTVITINGFRFFFYSNENNEPFHIDVTKGSAAGKIWLQPAIVIAYLHSFSNKDINDILAHIENNYELLKNKWDEHFGK